VKIVNVNELIEKLQKVRDKKKTVKLAVNGVVTGDFHLNDIIDGKLYLSNKNEEGYKEPELD
jgi:hypothetical protein